MDDQENDPQTYAIIGAAMAVHSELGPGFLEAVYQEALKVEFELRKIPAVDQVKLRGTYRGKLLDGYYVADFVCYESVIVELKALSEMTARDEAQLLNSLKATRFERGLLLNFGKKQPSIQANDLFFLICGHLRNLRSKLFGIESKCPGSVFLP